MSGSFETTDFIILECIKRATVLNKFECPAMLESETMAEFALTKFLSINPYSAHAILSSTESLSNFLSLTSKYQSSLVNMFGVPERSLNLLSSQVASGELAESKSVTTECSSTLNSPFVADRKKSRRHSYSEDYSDVTFDKKHKRNSLEECSDATGSILPLFEKYKAQKLEKLNKVYEKPCQVKPIPNTLPDTQNVSHFLLRETQFDDREWECLLDQQTVYNKSEVIDQIGHSLSSEALGETEGDDREWECLLDQQTAYNKSEVIDQIGHSLSSEALGETEGEHIRIDNYFSTNLFDISQGSMPEIDFSYQDDNVPTGKQTMKVVTNQHSEISDTSTNRLDQWDNMSNSSSFSFGHAEITSQVSQYEASAETECSSKNYLQDMTRNYKQNMVRKALEKHNFTRRQHSLSSSQDGPKSSSSRINSRQSRISSEKKRKAPVCNQPNYSLFRGSLSSIQSPRSAPFTRFRYNSTSQAREKCKKEWQSILSYPKSTQTPVRSRQSIADSIRASTPQDKQAKQRLSFIRGGTDKQSRLFWSDADFNNAKKQRIDRRF